MSSESLSEIVSGDDEYFLLLLRFKNDTLHFIYNTIYNTIIYLTTLSSKSTSTRSKYDRALNLQIIIIKSSI